VAPHEPVERRLLEQESSRMVIGGDSTSRGGNGPSYCSSDSRSWSAMGKLVTGDRPWENSYYIYISACGP
jgi:hypothetical protein